MKIVLGSSSSHRHALLTSWGIEDILVVPPEIDERQFGNRNGDAGVLVSDLGKLKALAVMKRLAARQEKIDDGWIVLTGDLVVLHNGRILEKPSSLAEVKQWYSEYCAKDGSALHTIGSVVLTDVATGTQVSLVEKTTFHFESALSEDDMRRLTGCAPDDSAPDDSAPDDSAPDGSAPDGSAPDGSAPDGGPSSMPACMSCAGGVMIEHPAVAKHVLITEGSVDSIQGIGRKAFICLLDQLKTEMAKKIV